MIRFLILLVAMLALVSAVAATAEGYYTFASVAATVGFGLTVLLFASIGIQIFKRG